MNERFPINLESLIELSARLNETHDNRFILNAALLSLMGKLTISNGCVLTPDKKLKTLHIALSKGHYAFVKQEYFEIPEFIALTSDEKHFEELYRNGIRYLVPIRYREKILGIVCLGKRLIDNIISANEILYINLVSSITANAMQISNEHNDLINIKTKLEYRNLTLTTLFEISREFSTFNSYEKIVKLLSLRLMGHLMVNKFALYIVHDKANIESVINRCDKEINQKQFNDILQLTELISRNQNYPDTIKSVFEETEVEVIAPLILQDEIRGLLVVGPRLNKAPFTNENLNFIESLGITAITALENERLFRQELEKKKLENELNLALEIQKGLLPKEFIENDKYSIHGFTIPSRYVGGDYFDYIRISDDKLMVIIADVSGKGMAASLIMANLQSALRVLASLDMNLSEIANRLNRIVFENTSTDKFVTFFIALISFDSKIIEYVNAGHNPPLMVSTNGNLRKLEAEDVPLGIFDDTYCYHPYIIDFESGDRLLLYTDGITEAQNPRNDLFGEERLIELFKKYREMEPDSFSKLISDSIHEFAEDYSQHDDITSLTIKLK